MPGVKFYLIDLRANASRRLSRRCTRPWCDTPIFAPLGWKDRQISRDSVDCGVTLLFFLGSQGCLTPRPSLPLTHPTMLPLLFLPLPRPLPFLPRHHLGALPLLQIKRKTTGSQDRGITSVATSFVGSPAASIHATARLWVTGSSCMWDKPGRGPSGWNPPGPAGTTSRPGRRNTRPSRGSRCWFSPARSTSHWLGTRAPGRGNRATGGAEIRPRLIAGEPRSIPG